MQCNAQIPVLAGITYTDMDTASTFKVAQRPRYIHSNITTMLAQC